METRESWKKTGVLVVILVACVVRLADFPGRYEMRDFDERAYVQGGLALWEGITPTYDRTPAGPQTWISWAYAAAETTKYLLHPTAEERGTPMVLRPFRAGNHALFNIYRDWSTLRRIEIGVGEIIAIIGAAAAFMLGWKRGGLGAALLLGLTAAILPLFVELSGQARPYAMAWGFSFISLYYAARSDEKASFVYRAAIFMGLAIGSRVDMLLLLPVMWADVWDAYPDRKQKFASIVRSTLVTAMTSLLVAPWLLTDLIGNLRAIASVRLAEPSTGTAAPISTMFDFFVLQGLGIDLVLMAAAVFLLAPDRKRVRWGLGIYVVLLAISMLKGTGFGLRHQGAPIVALIVFAPIGMAAVAQRWPKAVPILLVCALALPAVNVVREIIQRKQFYLQYHATDWIERHVPSGTVVYLNPDIHDPLPTVESSNAVWDEVANPDAWMTKVKAGMDRFHISSDDYPRAFSESNMVVERGLRREWYILGSRPQIPDPRYDIRVFWDSVVFRMTDISERFKKTGGVLVCNDDKGIMPTDVGTPVVSWLNSHGEGVRIYCSPDVLQKLKDPDHLQDY